MNTIQHNSVVAISLIVALSIPNIASAVAVTGQGTWETTLQARDLNGNLTTVEAYYDTTLDITWLADANYAMTSGYDADGRMNWSTAKVWAATLNPYGSNITGWRLPITVDVFNSGCTNFPSQYQGTDCGWNITTHSEMSSMFYLTLNNQAGYNVLGEYQDSYSYGFSNAGPFTNLQNYHYWSVTGPAPTSSYAWSFEFTGGFQGIFPVSDTFYAWAVHDGDVGVAVPSTVPVPAAAWLLGSGLLGLVGLARRKRMA